MCSTVFLLVPQSEVVEITEGTKCVLLPFKTTDDLPMDITVEWRCSDSKHRMVHVFQNGQSQPDNQGRTEMKQELLRTGDLSLILRDPDLDDQGVYTCTVYETGREILLQKIVVLSVNG